MKKIFFICCSVLMMLLLFGNVVFARNSACVIRPTPTYGPSPSPSYCPNVPTSRIGNHCINTGEKYKYPNNNPSCWSDDSYYGYGTDYWYDRNVRPIEKGWHSDNVGKYYYRGDGTYFRNGWYWIDGKYYKFDNSGHVYRNQWIKDNGAWYFVDPDGACVTGWKNIDNVWYYFNPEMSSLYGVMARDTMMYINGGVFGSGYFAFNKEGGIITNSWYGGHYYGSNGVRVD